MPPLSSEELSERLSKALVQRQQLRRATLGMMAAGNRILAERPAQPAVKRRRPRHGDR